jgi:hypothetical protein
LCKKVFNKLVNTTVAPPRIAAPVQLTVPPEVYALGTYWSKRLRENDKETIAPAKKMAKYIVVLPNIYRTAGKLGLKVGAIAE